MEGNRFINQEENEKANDTYKNNQKWYIIRKPTRCSESA